MTCRPNSCLSLLMPHACRCATVVAGCDVVLVVVNNNISRHLAVAVAVAAVANADAAAAAADWCRRRLRDSRLGLPTPATVAVSCCLVAMVLPAAGLACINGW